MSLQTRLSALIVRVGDEFKAIRILVGGTGEATVANLQTSATNLVGAINEVRTSGLTNAGAIGALINDAQITSSNTYSAQKIETLVTSSISNVIDAAPGALDTLNELAAALGDDPNFATTITNQLALKANAADVYTKAEMGDPETDLVSLLNASLSVVPQV